MENVRLMDMGAWVVENVLVKLTYSLEDVRLIDTWVLVNAWVGESVLVSLTNCLEKFGLIDLGACHYLSRKECFNKVNKLLGKRST